MLPPLSLPDRTPVWLALSEFYLDTELQDTDFQRISLIIRNSPYTLNEAKQIDKYELFPVLLPNLLSVAGVWTSFDEDWLLTGVTKRAKRPNWYKRFTIEPIHLLFHWTTADYWRQLEATVNCPCEGTDQ